jgi:hypothetical protein
MAERGMDARRSGDDQLDLRAKADQIAAIAETRATAKIAARATIALRCAERGTRIRLLDYLYYTGDAAKYDAAYQLAHDLSLELAAAYTMQQGLA